MLSKSKSKQIHLVKYLLVIPMVIGMLFYTSCDTQTENETKASNLEQYSYSLEKGEEMSEEVKVIHNKYEAFLKENKDYVSWSIGNHDTGKMLFSVHHKDEKRPIEMTKHKVTSPDGSYYTTYFNLPEVKNKNEKKVVQYDPLGSEEISFINIDQVPVFPGCETLATNDEKRTCFRDKIYMLVLENFNTNLSETLGLKGKQKIYTSFIISAEGNIVNVKSRAEHPELKKEAMRVLKLVPQLQPAIQGGKPVNVSFDLPIVFNIVE